MPKTTTEIIVRSAGGEVRIPVEDPVCDFCNAKLEDRPGGGLFIRRAVCHECWKKTKADAERYGEEKFLQECPGEIGLESWIRSMWA